MVEVVKLIDNNILKPKHATAVVVLIPIKTKCVQFEFDARYVKSSHNISDYISRHPVKRYDKDADVEHHINFITNYALPNAFTLEDIQTATSFNRSSIN